MKPIQLPKNLLLGSATSAIQIEGGDKNNNWYEWSMQGKIKDNSNTLRAANHWNRYAEDISLMKELNQKVYRMGLEWGKIEPKKGTFDKSAIEHYRDEISLLIENGITPLITLHHFSHPLWLCEEGEFENEKVVFYFERYARYVTENLGDLVCEYITINEPNVFVTNGYFFGSWPPGKTNFKLALKVFRNMTLCHIKAYKAIHEIRKERNFKGKTMVGIANHLRVFVPYSKNNVFDRLAAKLMDYLFQSAIIKSMTSGRFSFPIGFGAPFGVGRYYDFIGINYYTRTGVHFKSFKDEFLPNTPKNDLGWEIYPEGLSILCKRFYKKYKTEIWITENGICDKNDSLRSKFIYDHLNEIAKLNSEGIPVTRYYHWSLIDNFEWLDGESAPFGLIHIDFDSGERTVKESGKFYGEICKIGNITEEIAQKYISETLKNEG